MSSELEHELRAGNTQRFGELFLIHQPRLWQTIHFRLNDRIRGRVDTDDVVQEVYLAAEKRLSHYLDGDFPSLFLWLRLITAQVLSDIHRQHLGTESRSVSRESGPTSTAGHTSICLSQRFVAHLTSPSQAVARDELIVQVRESLDAMTDLDREIVALRHFEELTNQEVAQELGITPKAASIRYMRALERLRTILERIESLENPSN